MLFGVTANQALWVSGGQRDELYTYGPTRWLTAGLAASTSRTERTCLQFAAGAGVRWPEDQPKGWVIDCRLEYAVRVAGPVGIDLSFGAQREEGRQLSTSDFFARGGIRFGPIWGAR